MRSIPNWTCKVVREGAGTKSEDPKVRSAADVFALFRDKLADLPHEEFHVAFLNTQNTVIGTSLVTRGVLDASLVHPREVFRIAVSKPCCSIIVVHNHPSGDPNPSAEDRAITRQLKAAGEVIGIQVLDHVIVGDRRYVSFAEHGLLDA